MAFISGSLFQGRMAFISGGGGKDTGKKKRGREGAAKTRGPKKRQKKRGVVKQPPIGRVGGLPIKRTLQPTQQGQGRPTDFGGNRTPDSILPTDLQSAAQPLSVKVFLLCICNTFNLGGLRKMVQLRIRRPWRPLLDVSRFPPMSLMIYDHP